MTPEEAAAAAAAEIAGEAVEGSVPAGSTEGSAPPTEGLLIFYWLFHILYISSLLFCLHLFYFIIL